MKVIVDALNTINYSLTHPTGWEIASVIISGLSCALTLVVLFYNHKSIKIAQASVRQATNLQLYEKRLELFKQLSDDNAFETVPVELKIVYSEEIYTLFGEISKLCHGRNEKISEYNILLHRPFDIHFNVCGETMREIERFINGKIQESQKYETTKRQADALIIQQNAINGYTKLLENRFCVLEQKMEQILKESIGIGG